MTPSRSLLGGAALLGLVAIVIAPSCQKDPVPADATPTAQPVQASAPVAGPCDSATTQMAMNVCYGEAAKAAQAQEDSLYAAARLLVHNRDSVQVPPLEAAELAWKQYRDAHCQSAAWMNDGGSIVPMVVAICRERIAAQRGAELKLIYLDTGSQ